MTAPVPHPVPLGARDPSSVGFQAVVHALKDRQFMVAAVLLGLTAAAGPYIIAAKNWSQVKTPVAWPKGVTVSEDFRWTNLPDRLGKYVLIDRRTNKQDPNTRASGEIVLPVETRETLGVGRYDDAPRRAARSSNWYVSRIYEDPTQPPDSPFHYWQLDVTYNTGSAEKVEHVPDRCMLGAGYVPSGPRPNVPFAADVSGGWEKAQRFVRAGFVQGGKHPSPPGWGEVIQYYTFLLNGANEPSWERVRLHMATTPWEKHCYFAKIQFMPKGWVRDVAACDRAAQSFVNAFLPEVLRALPTSAKIDELNHSGQSHK